MFERLKEDLQCVKDRDPAARSNIEIMLLYPGYKAVRMHRRANFFYKHKIEKNIKDKITDKTKAFLNVLFASSCLSSPFLLATTTFTPTFNPNKVAITTNFGLMFFTISSISR